MPSGVVVAGLPRLRTGGVDVGVGGMTLQQPWRLKWSDLLHGDLGHGLRAMSVLCSGSRFVCFLRSLIDCYIVVLMLGS